MNENGYYTAWDGRRYVGRPPAGWFLAADNRWWPAPDLDADDQQTDYPTADHRSASPDDPLPPQPDESSAPPAANHDLGPTGQAGMDDVSPQPSQQAPPASWAPTANERRRAESEPAAPGRHGRPATPSAPVPRTRSRRRNRGGFGRRLIPIVFFFFLFNRCGVFSGDATVDLDEFGPDAVLTEASEEDFSLRTGCSSTFLWGSITNESTQTMTFVARTARTDGGNNYDSEPTTIPAGDFRSWSIPFSTSDEPDGFCPAVEILVVIPG